MTRLPGLDLLRSIAVLWVMLFHSYIVGGAGPWLDGLARFGWAGVDIFFVLSGYLIGGQWLRALRRGEPTSWRRFYARRAWRILPAFWAVLAVYLAFPGLREAPGLQPAWQFLSFTLNLLIDYGRHQAFSHAWSLCVEEHFYLVFPLLAAGLARWASGRRMAALFIALVLAGIALRGAVWLHHSAAGTQRNWFIEDLYYPTSMRLDGLLVGVMLATLEVFRPQLWARLQTSSNRLLVLGCAICGAALWLFNDRTGLPANTVGWPLLSAGIGLLVLAAADRHSVVGRRAIPGAAWIAGISYSLYLSHKLAYHAVQTMLAPQADGPLLFAAYAGASLLLGWALHAAVERPCLRWRDRRAAVAALPHQAASRS